MKIQYLLLSLGLLFSFDVLPAAAQNTQEESAKEFAEQQINDTFEFYINNKPEVHFSVQALWRHVIYVLSNYKTGKMTKDDAKASITVSLDQLMKINYSEEQPIIDALQLLRELVKS